DRKSTRLNSSHVKTSYAVFCLKKKRTNLDQVLAQMEALQTAATVVEDDAESSCGRCVEGSEAIRAVSSGCKRCGDREAIVLVLPCRHLCLCTVCCSASLRTCPVCGSVMNTSLFFY